MDSLSVKTLQMPALGRPFNLGMLYDCREDSLVPAITLWDPKDLEKDRRFQQKPNNKFEIVTSESINAKSSALNVEASLKASFLCGLVQVDGSAKYLNDQKTSNTQARVTLKYNATTKFEELSMMHLDRIKVKHPNVFETGIATHVVTGITYGAQAFFVFDREISTTENQQEVEGNLQVMIKKIPCFSIEGKGDLQMDDKDKANVDKFSCKFHGDFRLNKSPVSFSDAVEVYQSLPKLLGANGENAVPVQVWLLPLTALDSAAAKVVREISISLVNEAQSVLEDLNELEIRCNDALKTTTVQIYPQMCRKIKRFVKCCTAYKLDFQKVLAQKLPSIRGGAEEETELADILRKRCSSAFNTQTLSEWVDYKEKEIGLLKSYTKNMNTKVVQPNKGLDEDILHAGTTVCFVFTSLGGPDPYLDSLEKYFDKANGSNEFNKTEMKPWFLSGDVANAMRQKAKLFRDFAEANKENRNIKFLIMASTDEEHKGTSIYLYEGAGLPNKNFEPTSKPQSVIVSDTDYNNVTLKISPPEFGSESVSLYRVEVCVKGEDEWHQVSAPGAGEVVLKGLTPNTEYSVRVRAVSTVGLSPVYEMVDPIKTLPCSAPEKPQVEGTSTEISVKWEKPAELGEDIHISSYVVEYTEADKEVNWNHKYSCVQSMVISELQSETEYAVRVHCDCGVSGRSRNTNTVFVSTTKPKYERIAEYLKNNSKKIMTDSFPPLYKLPLKKEDNDIYGCRFYNFGKESTRQNRTLMLVGATGSGKSTLINSIVNYIAGVEWKDSFRFKLVHENPAKSQAESQTSEVSVYKLNHQEGFKIPFSLTLVDTPGFGDTRGIQRDKEITEQIRELFTSTNGISSIDAVCFVTQASLARLTATQKYVFDSVLSIFGKDVSENILMLVTFADGKQPPVLEAINASGVPCPKNELGFPVHFKFNNSVLFADNRCDANDDESDDNFDEIFWRMCTKSMQKFFTDLSKMETKSLTMTKEVLKERKQLEAVVNGLQDQVKAGLAKLQEIKATKEKIKDHETAMTSNENHEIEVEVIKPVKVPLANKNEYLTNCQVCHVTCHYPCAIKKDSEKNRCSAMDSAGQCVVCPGKCNWNLHVNQGYKWVYAKEMQKMTLREMKEKYTEATKEKLTVEELIERKEEEIEILQDLIMSLIDQSAQSVTRLSEIALRPNPLTTPDYIDMLIQGEESEAKPGYKERIQALEAMRDNAKIISKVSRKDKIKELHEEHKMQSKNQGEDPAEEQQPKGKDKTLFGRIRRFFNF